ncbi:MAG: alanine racemase [Candidatus Omnitrophica bacterium 4484_49]|nr:MAG: alanine racemase [Candidatus Omnitrophica bacterium 4484_49]
MMVDVKIKRDLKPRYWLEIDLSAITENVSQIKSVIKSDTRIIAVIKSNAYGHGLLEVASALDENVDFFAVAEISEAVKLREAEFQKPILFLSNPLFEEEIEAIFDYDIIPAVNSMKFLKLYQQYAHSQDKCLDIHLKIDTGMSRMGISWQEIDSVVSFLSDSKNINLRAVFTHFAHTQDLEFTRMQMERFQKAISKLKNAGFKFFIHAANSSAVLRYSTSWFDCIRPGLIIYGIYPEHEVKNRIKLKQAMSFKTRLVEVKEVKKGSFIGYNCTYKATSDMKIGIIPVGYNQGLMWVLSNKGFVLLRGRRIPILGRVSMDQTILDLRDIANPEIGEEVVITGCQGEEEIRIEEIAEWAGTIPYEIACSFGKIGNRVYKEWVG